MVLDTVNFLPSSRFGKVLNTPLMPLFKTSHYQANDLKMPVITRQNIALPIQINIVDHVLFKQLIKGNSYVEISQFY